jgi:hypothetical protein
MNNHKRDWKQLEEVLSELYKKDIKYLEESFFGIEKLWTNNFEKLKSVKYVMLSEAPLWGDKKSYIYNVETPMTQFFYLNDLATIIGEKDSIKNKQDFLNKLVDNNFLILDLLPFAFNSSTIISYPGLSPEKYGELLSESFTFYFSEKLKLIYQKRDENLQFFYRYNRVKNSSQDIVLKALQEVGFSAKKELAVISMKGGGIDRKKLGSIMNA